MNKKYQKTFPGRKNAGFTLIELLVVVLIIGILAAVAIPQYEKAVSKSRYVQLMGLVDSIAKTATVYYWANGVYPPTLEDLDITLPGTLSDTKTELFLDNGYLCQYFMDSNAADAIVCYYGHSSSTQRIGYRIAFEKGRITRFCVASQGNKKNEEFCRSLGGKGPVDNGGALFYYQLD